MATISGNTITLGATDKPRIERLMRDRTKMHPEDEREFHRIGAMGDIAFVLWAEHHSILVEGPIARSACNAVIRNRGSWSDRVRVGVRATDERGGIWQQALRFSGYNVHRLARAGVNVVVVTSVAWDGEHPVVTLRGCFDLPGGVGRRADLELNEALLVDLARFLPV